jgi:hypothetical protein
LAIFFEPFETGHLIAGRALKDLATRSEEARATGMAEPIPDDALAAFRRLWVDWDVRKGRDKSAAIYQDIDDKWLFTRSYLEEVGASCGFESITTYNLYPADGLFSRHLGSLLRLMIGKSFDALPEWARMYLHDLDENFSPDARRDLIIEGGIIMKN